jgi:hypothetical protein
LTVVVGMISAYKEGRLVQQAIRSLLEIEPDRLYVFEGPAGEPLGAHVPESVYPAGRAVEPVVFHRGRWRSDGRKRNEMLQRAKVDFPGPFWCVVVDADEVLVNGRYLRDRLDWIEAEDAFRRADSNDPDNPPMARWPLHLVEHDGSMSMITARVFRGDLLRSIDISSSVVTNVHGVQDGWGNFEAASALWVERWLQAIDAGKMIAWPPQPCEPHIVHRSNLRHPLRRGLRMSAQETASFREAAASMLEHRPPQTPPWPGAGIDENDYSPETP